MKQRWKKIAAVMLVIIMVLGMVPNMAVTVHAEEAAAAEQAADNSEDSIADVITEERVTEGTEKEVICNSFELLSGYRYSNYLRISGTRLGLYYSK